MTNEIKMNPHDVIGSLLEAAIRDQDAIGKAVSGLKKSQLALDSVTTQLPKEVAKKVDESLKDAMESAACLLLKKFNEANAEAAVAKDAYEKAAKFAIWHLTVLALGITTITASIIVGAAWYVMPNLSEIEARRAERDILENRIAWLKRIENSDITNCKLSDGRKVRLCAKIDPKFLDEWGGYRVLAPK